MPASLPAFTSEPPAKMAQILGSEVAAYILENPMGRIHGEGE